MDRANSLDRVRELEQMALGGSKALQSVHRGRRREDLQQCSCVLLRICPHWLLKASGLCGRTFHGLRFRAEGLPGVLTAAGAGAGGTGPEVAE